MQAQFARGGEPSGIAHAEPMPSDLPPPEECPSRADMLAELLTRAPASLRPLIEEAQAVPVEVRYACNRLPDPLDLDPPPQPSRQLLWVRIRDPISSGPSLNEACAAYLSDEPLLLTALRPHSIGFPSPKLGAFATLDHSMWFHAPFKADEWLLYEMSSPHAGAGRALCFGHLYRPTPASSWCPWHSRASCDSRSRRSPARPRSRGGGAQPCSSGSAQSLG